MQLQVLKTPKQSHPKVLLRYQDIANRDKRFLWKITYSYGQLPLGRTLQHAWGIKLYKLDWIESALLMGQKINQSEWKIYLKWLTGSSCRSQGYLIFVESLKCPKLRGCWREIQTAPFTISIWILDIVSHCPRPLVSGNQLHLSHSLKIALNPNNNVRTFQESFPEKGGVD